MNLRKLTVVSLFSLVSAACASSPSQTTDGSRPLARPANALTAVASSPQTIAEPRVRVGLLDDQKSATFDRIEGGYVILSSAGASRIGRGFTVEAPVQDATVTYAVQAAALANREAAEQYAARIRTADPALVVTFHQARPDGLVRVLVGSFETSEAASPAREKLQSAGLGTGMLIVRRPAEQQPPARLTLRDDEGDVHTFAEESILVLPAEDRLIEIGDQPYRGGARLFVNSRGLLNVINELNLEDYVRGVVPNEMGPSIFDELEAMKVQALAARTYVVRRLGEFSHEGYDICPTPACQVYKGAGTEHALSDQAIRDTAGLVIAYNGEPIDALFTSTCGGETSDVGTMFPGRNEPYLKRARCVEYEMTELPGRTDSGLLTDMQADARLFATMTGQPPSARAWTGRDVSAAVAAAMQLAGFQFDASSRPASSRRGDVLRFVGQAWQLANAGRVLTLPEDRRYFFPQTGTNVVDDATYTAAAFLIKYRILPSQSIDRVDLQTPMPREELFALLYSWLREHNVISETTGKIAEVSGREITLKAEGKLTRYTIPAGTPAFRRLNDRVQEYSRVPIMIGDRGFLMRQRDRVVGLFVQANYDGAAFDRTSSFSNWTRSYRADELTKSIGKRATIQSLVDIRPVTIDPSHRIAEMEFTDQGGRTFRLAGLMVRWALGVPDNLFVYTKGKDPDGVDRYTFFGKGWGHGVGMCQVGAYGMAFRGWKADQIVKRYYTGVEIVPMASLPQR